MAKMEHLHKRTIIIQYVCVLLMLCSAFCVGVTIYNHSRICELEDEVHLLRIFMSNVKKDLLRKAPNFKSNTTSYLPGPEKKIFTSDTHSREYRFKRNAPKSNEEIHNNHENKSTPPLKLYDLLGTTHHEGLQNRSSYRSPSDAALPIFTRTSRVMFADGKPRVAKHVTKKPLLKSLNLETHQDNHSFEVETHRPRHRPRHRQKMVETFDEQQFTVIRPTRKHIPAVHFSGDSSKYTQGQDINFNGNGHMRHLSKTYVDWKPSDWVESLRMEQYFNMDNGVLTVKEPGLYLVYAQIYYLDQHDLNGYMVYKNSHSILQCTTMTHSREPVMKSNTCYTAGVEHFSEGDKLRIQDLSDGRYSLFEREKSFFGAVKLSDSRNK